MENDLRMVDDLMNFMESRPLVGFQMDGTHLHSVLERIICEQQQQAQVQGETSRRIADMESDLRELHVRQKNLEKVLGDVGPDTFRTLHQRIDAVQRDLDDVARGAKEAGQLGASAAEAAANVSRGLQNVERDVFALQDRQERLHQGLSDVAEEIDRQSRQMGEAVRTMEREQALQAEQTERMREIINQLDQEAFRESLQNLRETINEFCDRTEKNFRSIEESAQAVDLELNSHRADLTALQKEFAALQEKMRQNISSIAKDVDQKCQMIIDTLREHEKSSLEMEEHMVAAGQALARRQALRQQRALSGSRSYDQVGSRRNAW